MDGKLEAAPKEGDTCKLDAKEAGGIYISLDISILLLPIRSQDANRQPWVHQAREKYKTK